MTELFDIRVVWFKSLFSTQVGFLKGTFTVRIVVWISSVIPPFFDCFTTLSNLIYPTLLKMLSLKFDKKCDRILVSHCWAFLSEYAIGDWRAGQYMWLKENTIKQNTIISYFIIFFCKFYWNYMLLCLRWSTLSYV